MSDARTKQNHKLDSQLFEAVKQNDLTLIKQLIDDGANLNSLHKVSYFKYTCLYKALSEGNIAAAKILIDAGADINLPIVLLHLDIHPLQATINEKNGLEGLWLMINSGVDLKSFKDSWNPLMDICQREEDQGFMNILFAYCKILIKNGINVNYINPDNETPLFAASVRGHKNIAKLLLDNGAEKNLASCFLFEDYKSIHSIKNRSSTINHEAYVLCMAAAKGNIELLKSMKNHGVDLNTSMIDKFGDVMTALNYVTNKSTTEWLLENGATPIKNDNNQIASGELCRATNDFEGTEKIELLLKAGANANDKDSYTLATALHTSLNSWMPYNKAKLLLDYGADITARDKDQLSAMHYLLSNEACDHSSEINYGKGGSSFATEEEILNTIDLLIEYGADAKLKDIAGNTPLHMAAKRGYGEKVIKKLIDLGNDPQEKNLYGETPAIRAAKHFKHEAFNLLASSTDKEDLVSIVCLSNADIAKEYIDKADHLNISDCEYFSLLHYAVKRDSIDIIKAIIEKGVNINAFNKHNKTAFDLAKYMSKIEITEYLVENGAKTYEQIS